MDQRESFHQLNSCIDLLESAASVFVTKILGPHYVQTPGGHFEYEKPDVRTLGVLRCVRIVSDFRATMALLERGHVQQVGVILRTILEFSHDLDFIVEGFINPESIQRINEMVSQFFSERFPDAKQLMEQTGKEPTTPRKKIYAAIGRLLGLENPHRYRQIAKIMEDTYSGYVHGNYYYIMELYNGTLHKFEMGGQPLRIRDRLHNVALTIHHVLNQFSTIALAFDLKHLEQDLISKRKELETSRLYIGVIEKAESR